MNEIDFKSLRYNRGGFKLSKEKLLDVCAYLNFNKKEIKMVKKNIKNIKEVLLEGDTQPAKVISCEPLLIATYSDEFDAVLILKFPVELVERYQLYISQKLVSVNYYTPKQVFDIAPDIIPGKFTSNNWRDIIPFIPLFLSEDEVKCKEMTTIHPDFLWDRFEYLINEYLEKKPNQHRNGFKSIIYY